MGACRETQNIWFHLKKVAKQYAGFSRWKMVKMLMSRKFYGCYFLHDSFGRYFNKFIGCPILGHRNVIWLSDGNCSDDRPKHYCFNCEQEVDPGISKINSGSTTE